MLYPLSPISVDHSQFDLINVEPTCYDPFFVPFELSSVFKSYGNHFAVAHLVFLLSFGFHFTEQVNMYLGTKKDRDLDSIPNQITVVCLQIFGRQSRRITTENTNRV